ncbi:NLRC3-like protein, partial [Drosera capensis]
TSCFKIRVWKTPNQRQPWRDLRAWSLSASMPSPINFSMVNPRKPFSFFAIWEHIMKDFDAGIDDDEGDDNGLRDGVYQLPSELFDCLVTKLSPFALYWLQLKEPHSSWSEDISVYDSSGSGRKQELTEAIGFKWQNIMGDLHKRYSLLYFQCDLFGCYARYLRLQNVFCTPEICKLLQNSELHGLVLWRILNQVQVDGLCRILDQNRNTLTSIELVNCNLSFPSINAICGSLCKGNLPRVKHFALKRTKLTNGNSFSLPPNLVLLLSGRSLYSLTICNCDMERDFAKLVLRSLLDVASNLSSLDLSENKISGWLSDFLFKTSDQPLVSSDGSNCLHSLRVLNLMGNSLCKNDIQALKSALVVMPSLEILDLSDNPIGDEGVRSLIPCFAKSSKHLFLSDLNLENCKLSCHGVNKLLQALSTTNYPLVSLSLADNDLGSQVTAALGKFLGSSIKSLDVRDIGLGSSGFRELKRCMGEGVNLVSINISENRGGTGAAEFLLRLVSVAPKLVSVDAGYNLLPTESLSTIGSALDRGRGKLRHLDLTGNQKLCEESCIAVLAEFRHNGEPVVRLPTSHTSGALYDDDP